VNFVCVAYCSRHWSVISCNQNVLLISIRSEWYSSRLGIPCTQFVGDSGSEFEKSLVAVNQHAARSLCPGVISATFLGVEYCSLSLEKSYGSKHASPNSEPFAVGKILLCRTFWGLMMDIHWCLAQYSFSTNFRKASWYQVV